MSSRPFWYEIRVEEPLEKRWSDWFAGMEIIPADCCGGCGTTLRGLLPDQAALFGLLGQLRDLHLTIIEVKRLDRQG